MFQNLRAIMKMKIIIPFLTNLFFAFTKCLLNTSVLCHSQCLLQFNGENK